MIETYCSCLEALSAKEEAVGTSIGCPKCKAAVSLVSAEAISPEHSLGDFDARLVITAGPAGVGQVLALGGLPDLEIGKSTDRHIQLPGTSVSRAHARLKRLDFGPSRWQIVDTQSRNGLFVNENQVSDAELEDGDIIQIGEFELRYMTAVPRRVIPAAQPGEVVCPSCKLPYPEGTQVCVHCGINIKTGRPLVTSRAMDEQDLADRTYSWVRYISWVVRFGLFPVASEAFGTLKATAIWWITGITVFTSLLFFIPYYSPEHTENPYAKPWVMWAGTTDGEADKLMERFRNATHGMLADDQLQGIVAQHIASQGEFHYYQLLTQAFVHAGIMHLAGNLVFMLVFGIRVNELIGNLKFAIIYPLLAVSSAAIFLFAARNDPLIASLGASGAIMGLAGMYFVFFPVQKVHMVIWLRLGLFTGYRVRLKMFRMSGFWLLVLWLGINDLLPTLLHGSDAGDGVAHWAHLGGFISGFVIAVGLLLTRQVNAHGSDLLSMALGPTAWKLLGRPGAQTA